MSHSKSLLFSQKLSKVAAPDPFTATSSSVKDGSRKIGDNKLIGRPSVGGSSSSKNRYQVRVITLVVLSAY
jgi:hypothetical protein